MEARLTDLFTLVVYKWGEVASYRGFGSQVITKRGKPTINKILLWKTLKFKLPLKYIVFVFYLQCIYNTICALFCSVLYTLCLYCTIFRMSPTCHFSTHVGNYCSVLVEHQMK